MAFLRYDDSQGRFSDNGSVNNTATTKPLPRPSGRYGLIRTSSALIRWPHLTTTCARKSEQSPLSSM